MNSSQFKRAVRRAARARGLDYREDRKRGKGGHSTIYVGDSRTVVPAHSKDLKRGLVLGMLAQLGLREEDI